MFHDIVPGRRAYLKGLDKKRRICVQGQEQKKCTNGNQNRRGGIVPLAFRMDCWQLERNWRAGWWGHQCSDMLPSALQNLPSLTLLSWALLCLSTLLPLHDLCGFCISFNMGLSLPVSLLNIWALVLNPFTGSETFMARNCSLHLCV